MLDWKLGTLTVNGTPVCALEADPTVQATAATREQRKFSLSLKTGYKSETRHIGTRIGDPGRGPPPGLMTQPKHSLSGFEPYFAAPGAGKTILSLKKNAVIFSQGDPAETVFYIQKGRVKLHVVSDHGKEAVVAMMEAGQFFGEACLNGGFTRVATAVSLGDSTIVSISKHAMLEALKNEPRLAQLFVTYLITRTSRVEEDLIDQLFNSSERRLARLLLLLAHFGKEGAPEPIDVEISQETLAEMIGTTRSRVSFFMNKFRKLGFISYNGKIHVHNSLLNAVLHDKPALRTDD